MSLKRGAFLRANIFREPCAWIPTSGLGKRVPLRVKQNKQKEKAQIKSDHEGCDWGHKGSDAADLHLPDRCSPSPGSWLGPPVVPFYPFWGEGSPIKVDYRQKGTLILTSLLEDLISATPAIPEQLRWKHRCGACVRIFSRL